MKIAIDGFELNSSFTGVGRYLFNLLKSILKFDTTNKYTIFLKEPPFFDFNHSNLTIEVLDFTNSHTKWQNSILIKALNSCSFDLFFSPDHSLPLLYKGKSILTIHDPSWKSQKSDYSLKERIIRDIKTKISLKKAELIFTVSEFTKNETLKYYKYPSEKIIPIHSAVENIIIKPDIHSITNFKSKYQLEGYKTIGFLGSMFKRRHITELIEAFKLIKNQKVKLFLIGKDFSNLNLEKNDSSIIWLKRIDENEINDFYSSLDLFLYLSEYEGFGFPPMEALLNNTVSLLVKGSSLSEIFKDIAHFTNSIDPLILKEKILSILKDKDNFNQKLLQNFLVNKRIYFSWDRVAKEYLNYIQAL